MYRSARPQTTGGRMRQCRLAAGSVARIAAARHILRDQVYAFHIKSHHAERGFDDLLRIDDDRLYPFG